MTAAVQLLMSWIRFAIKVVVFNSNACNYIHRGYIKIHWRAECLSQTCTVQYLPIAIKKTDHTIRERVCGGR